MKFKSHINFRPIRLTYYKHYRIFQPWIAMRQLSTSLLSVFGKAMAGAILFYTSSVLHADIINPNVLELVQPDGTKIELRFKGSGRLNWYEDLSGFPVVKIDDTYYYQLSLDPNESSRLPLLEVGKVDPKDAGVELISPLQRLEIFNEENPEAEGSLGIPGQTDGVQAVPPVGNIKNLVILIRFSDHSSRVLPSKSDFETLFNAVGGDPVLAPTGSIRDIYLENSYQQLTLDSTVVDWYTVSNTEPYYADGESGLLGNVPQALVEALNNADTLIDFSQFDSDSDGFIDAITFVHSGYGAEWGGTDIYGTDYTNRIWSHKSSITTWTSNESVSVSNYNINPGVWSTSGNAIGRVGVIAHELGHFFGLPDLYDYTTPGSGIGSWGLMANSWGFTGNQLNPPHMSAWSKIQLGWVIPMPLTTGGTYSANQAATNQDIFRIDKGFPTGEYLLIENRQPVGIESTMPQGGLAVWHIDENRSNNSDQSYPPLPDWPAEHYRIALLQADGSYDLEKGNNRGDSGDVYHGNSVNAINSTTTPSTDSYQSGNFVPTGVSISNISTSGPSMSFNYDLPPPDPTFIYPIGGETFTQGGLENITWNTNNAAASTLYTVEVGGSCLPSDIFVEDVESTPSNFNASNAGGTFNFVSDTNNPYEGAGNWHADNPNITSDLYLTTTSPVIVPDINPTISFWHSFDIEAIWDGGVVEASNDSGQSWIDLGQWITQGGYNATLNNTPNPLAGRSAFSGNSGGYINTDIDMSAFGGDSILLRFRMGSDGSVGTPTYAGWDIDFVTVSGASPSMTTVGSVASSVLPWIVSEPAGSSYCFSVQGTDAQGSSNIVYSGNFDIVTAGSGSVYISPSNPGNPAGVGFNYYDEDIIVHNGVGWSMYFDGSDVGLGGSPDLNAFHIMNDGSLLLSFDTPVNLNGTLYDDSDIVLFNPTSLGNLTSGTFSMYFDGSANGFDTIGEDIDAISINASGELIISTLGSAQIPRPPYGDLTQQDDDLARLRNSDGVWLRYFDGSDVGFTFATEDIWGTQVDLMNGTIYLTTLDGFTAAGLSGDGNDIFTCTPGTLGNATACTLSLFWDGDNYGLGGERIDAMAIK